MKRVERKRGIDNGGNTILDLQVSKVSDLPTLGGKLDTNDTITVGAGSCAEIIQAGKFATLDDDGTWYDSDGAAVNATSNTSNLASPAMIDNGALLGQGKNILTANETEHIEPETDEPKQVEPDELDTESEVTEDER